MKNSVANVSYHGHKVGRIAMTRDGVCAFEYDADWLDSGFSISPFKLPLQKKVFIASRDPFGGNFGVFDDSLPDGWGRLLVDRMLIKKRVNPAEVSIIDRLAIVGSSGMGALEYMPQRPLTDVAPADGLESLAGEAEAILNEKYDGKLEELAHLGGSSGGARPKVLIRVDGADWLVKFKAGVDPRNIGRQEYDYSLTARDAGLEMPETRLFEGKFFGVRRFDRKPDGEKVFMISASGLLNASHRLPTLDYNNLMDATLELTRDYKEAEKMFRLMCFNIFAHNRDDHAKNFSFLYDRGKWSVSPAYDLVYSEGMGGEHATSVDGEGRNPNEQNITEVARKAGIDPKTAKRVMEEVASATDRAKFIK
ncbi:MAG: type II toxin-antitoxin system HipA family toxin [Synergistaceae bacterium]|jgi:serine/threonine-protein kinase HipA|nr:type II toxin-antitoxin system HipA family toxin [Synergistaceae bacterium]